MAGLLDFLQSASNAAASNVSGPVDGIAWLLRKAGIPVNEPVGGSAWMERQGLTRPVQQSAASLAGESVGLLAPIVAAAKAPQIAKGLLQVGENAAAPRMLRDDKGAIDVDAFNAAIQQHKQRLLDEANNWAGRKYKQNEKVVHFSGDGPGPEAMRIGAINEGRRNANIESRLASVRALNSLSDSVNANPARIEAIYLQAADNAKRDAAARGWDYSNTLDSYLGQNLAGLKDSSFGPTSVGGSLRAVIEASIAKPQKGAMSSSSDDYLKELFGGN